MTPSPSRSSWPFPIFLGLMVAGFCSPGTARAEETTVHLELVDWDLPPGTRIQATIRARLKVYFVDHQGVGPDGKAAAELLTPIDEVAPETLHWEVVTSEGSRASKEFDFTFPVELRGLTAGLAGELFEMDMKILDPGKEPGAWEVAHTTRGEFGLFLKGPRLEKPTACVRFMKDGSGYSTGLAWECTAESFEAVLAAATTCPTCELGKGGH